VPDRPGIAVAGSLQETEAMNRCQECGRLRTLIWNPATNRRLCPDCMEIEPPSAEDLAAASRVARLRENEWCLRCVENHDQFELLFVPAASNAEALKFAAMVWGFASMSARAVEE
jgi:hypothetical protein